VLLDFSGGSSTFDALMDQGNGGSSSSRTCAEALSVCRVNLRDLEIGKCAYTSSTRFDLVNTFVLRG
jgi:hypothetical protein